MSASEAGNEDFYKGLADELRQAAAQEGVSVSDLEPLAERILNDAVDEAPPKDALELCRAIVDTCPGTAVAAAAAKEARALSADLGLIRA